MHYLQMLRQCEQHLTINMGDHVMGDGSPSSPYILTKEHADYRCWMYFKAGNGEMESAIFTAEEAKLKFEDGWRSSPSEFVEDENIPLKAAADDLSTILNQLLNIENIQSREILLKLATQFFKLKIHPKLGVKKIRAKIMAIANEQGLLDTEDE